MASRYKGLRIVIQGTSLDFSIGDALSPTWDDLRIVVRKIWELGYAPLLLPENVEGTVLVAGNREQLHSLVPLLIQNIHGAFERGKIQVDDEYRIVGIGYVMAWYWHKWLGGPRPAVGGTQRRFRPVYQTDILLTCPFCGKVAPVPERFKKSSSRSKYFIEWLTRHNAEYHKWDIKYNLRKEYL